MFTTLLLCVTLVALAIAPVRPPPNLPPVANDDVVIVQYQSDYVDIQVLKNDFDPEGAPLTVVAVPSADGGKPVILKGRVIRVYLPPEMAAPDWVPPIYLLAEGTYLVSDGVNMSMAGWRIFFEPQ